MIKEYTSLGLMSGTSVDGVDASIIKSNGVDRFSVIEDKYFEYPSSIYKNFHNLKEKINNNNDLKSFSKELSDLERQITLFNAKVINEICEQKTIDLIGFHGQTIYHNSQEKISLQLGDGKLLSQLSKKNVVYRFRQNDISNGGEGAPLTPIFHQLIATTQKLDLPVCFLNIGGISNITTVNKPTGSLDFNSRDIGPGNCLIDSWVRKNSEKKFDSDGTFASRGKRNDIIFEQAQELYSNRTNKGVRSFDVSDFDISFVRGLSLEDGCATLTDFTASLICSALISTVKKKDKKFKIIISGGGRKNKVLIKKLKKNSIINLNIHLIDEYGLDGDFIESQAFGFLAIRSILKLPISFPKTTGCSHPLTGGKLIEY